MAFVELVVHLFDPRGRCNRKGLLVVAIVLLVLQVGLGAMFYGAGIDFSSPAIGVLKLVFFWLALAAASKRLHDLGLSGWWVAKSFAIMLAWTTALALALMLTFGDRAMREGETGFWILLAGNMLPVLVLTLWLHFARGMSGANPFGDEPSGLGFSHPAGNARFLRAAPTPG